MFETVFGSKARSIAIKTGAKRAFVYRYIPGGDSNLFMVSHVKGLSRILALVEKGAILSLDGSGKVDAILLPDNVECMPDGDISPKRPKKCHQCKETLPADSFKRVSGYRSFDGRSHVCRVCEKDNQRRRAKVCGRIRRVRELYMEGSHTEQEWAEVLLRYGNKCLRCGTKGEDTAEGALTKDHVRAVADLGTDDISNIQPLCRSCNSWKGKRTLDFRPEKHRTISAANVSCHNGGGK